MDWDGWPTAEQWSAFWAFATFGVAAVAAFIALRQFRAYAREQEERARPYLIVDFWFKANFSLYITVQNISGTPATNVTMMSSPLPLSHGRSADYDKSLAEVFGGGLVIPQLAPGATMRWYIGAAHELLSDPALPHRFEILVKYTDPRGRASRGGGPKQYVDPPFILDLAAFGLASGDSDYASKNWNIADRNERRFEAMKGSLASVASTLDTLVSSDAAAKAAQRHEPMLKRRRRRQTRRC